MFREDGRLVADPEKVLNAIERNGYTSMLYTATGKVIKDPHAFVDSRLKEIKPVRKESGGFSYYSNLPLAHRNRAAPKAVLRAKADSPDKSKAGRPGKFRTSVMK